MFASSIRAVRRSGTILSLVAALTAPATAQITPRLKTIPTIPAPQGFQVSADRYGVRLTWQPVTEAAQYLVLRGADVNTVVTQIGAIPAGSAYYLDQGFNAPAAYQVIAVAANGRRGASVIVAYTPPAALATPIISTTSLVGTRSSFTTLSSGLGSTTAPALATFSGVTPASPYPGQTVTLTGANLSGVTAITVGIPDRSVTAANPPLSVVAAVPAHAISAIDANNVSFPWPLNSQWWIGSRLVVQVTTAAGTSTTTFDVAVDRQPYITGATKPLARAGGRIELTGRNLDGVSAGYIGAVAVNTASNPRLAAAPGWMGLSASILTPANCSREGILLLEGYTAIQGSGSTQLVPTLGATPVRGGCGMTPTGTSVTPPVARPGTTVRVRGQGFTWMTGVRHGAQNLNWTPISDTEFDLVLPALAGRYGSDLMPLYLLNNIPDGTVAGSVSPPPIVAYPPLAEGLSATWAECCETVTLSGRGLLDGTASRPTIKLNGIPVGVTSASQTSVVFEMPYPSASAPTGPVSVTVEHLGGSSTAPSQLIVVSGPSTITSISPAEIPVGVATTVTVQGTNLARARGICLPGATATGPFVLRPDPMPTSNTQFQVVVQAAAPLSGPLWVAVPPNVAQRQYTMCQANPTAVNIVVR